MRPQCEKLIVVLVSGRPLILTEQLPLIDGLVAAWLPGSEGQGVSDGLFGRVPFGGKLPYTWPRDMSSVSAGYGNSAHVPLFPVGFGL
jgi:beta-glucosidase